MVHSRPRQIFLPGLAATLALSLSSLMPERATAQNAGQADALPELVVTATRVPTSPEQVGSSITVITADELEEKQTTFVADALRRVPGLSVSRTGGVGNLTQVRIRGSEGNHTLVLIDGVEVNDLGFNSVFDFGNLLTDSIERIEILRGPQSTLWGGDAVGGVINIITKKGKGRPSVTAFVEGGSFQTGRGAATLSGSGGPWTYSLTGSHLQTHGISHANENNANRETDGYENDSLLASIGVQALDNLMIDVFTRYRNSTVETDPQTFNTVTFLSNPPADGNTRSDGRERQGAVKATADFLDGRLETIVSLQYADTDTASRNLTFGSPTFITNAARTKLEAQGNIHFNPANTLVLGTETEEEEIRSTTQTKTDVEIQAAYAQYLLSPLDNLDLSAGIRRDDHQSFGKEDTYRLTASYLFERSATRFKSSYGTGFKAPQLGELFGFFGNPALQPETNEAWDAGIVQDLWGGRIRGELTYFDNQIENLIIFTGGVLRNAGESDINGIETSLAVAATPELDITATYTWTNSRNKATGLELVRWPRHVTSIDTVWRFAPGWKTTLAATYTGEQDDLDFSRPAATRQVTLKAFTKVDTTLAYRISERYEVYGRIENLLDEDYEENVDYGVAGLSGYLGIRARF
ncbi:MAG: TonB-dependent receptor [Proteobacteria bacterium]|nr:TonB-dependent receptor [Pseudomonadota bacterium]